MVDSNVTELRGRTVTNSVNSVSNPLYYYEQYVPVEKNSHNSLNVEKCMMLHTTKKFSDHEVNRLNAIIESLRLDHLNKEEKENVIL
jgi:hypothetical protein